jgi:Tfp pilus assembly protein PilN
MTATANPPVSSPGPAPVDARRAVLVRASLLPEEVLSARQALVVRKQVIVALGVLIGLIAAAYAFFWWQTGSARSDLQAMQHRNAALTDQQNQFRPLVEAQNGTRRIATQLRTLMAGDLSWNDLVQRVVKAAPNGVVITDLDGSATDVVPGASGVTVPGEVGPLTLSGTAHDKNSVAAFADRLGRVRGVAFPLITSVASQNGQVTFSIDATITKDALGGRFATAVPAAGSTTGGN